MIDNQIIIPLAKDMFFQISIFQNFTQIFSWFPNGMFGAFGTYFSLKLTEETPIHLITDLFS